MNASYCYIDYTKSSSEDLNKAEISDEIKINSKYADLYFSAPVDNRSLNLIENSRFVLLLNGSLESKDKSIQSLLTLVEEAGVKEVLKTVDGVFTLSVYDKEKELFYISSDHFGVLPLYYYMGEDIVLYSNSLKAFKNSSAFSKKINFDILGQYLQHGYILQPNTLFSDCYRVKSAHFMIFNLKTKELKEEKYWDIVDFYTMPRVSMSEEEIIKKSEDLLKNAIKTKVGTSKSVGTFLSGGYDSSTITAMLHEDKNIELQSYTVGFEDNELNEAPYAKNIAEYLHINHHEYYFNAKNLENLLLSFAEVYDQPLADKAAIPTMLICKKSSSNVDILFGGEGGDEIFASSSIIKRLNQISLIPYPARLIVSKVLKLFSSDVKYEKYSKILKQKNIENILKYEDVMLSDKDIKRLIIPPIKEQPIEFEDLALHQYIHTLWTRYFL